MKYRIVIYLFNYLIRLSWWLFYVHLMMSNPVGSGAHFVRIIHQKFNQTAEIFQVHQRCKRHVSRVTVAESCAKLLPPVLLDYFWFVGELIESWLTNPSSKCAFKSSLWLHFSRTLMPASCKLLAAADWLWADCELVLPLKGSVNYS